MLQNDFKFTEEMRLDLRRHLNGEQTLGHFAANLDFSQQSADADQNQQSKPDAFYHQAQGQEPPQQAPRRLSMRTVCCWVMFWVIVAEIILLFWPGMI